MGQRQAQPRIRRDGWTADRQLRFLDELARTRSVVEAAASAGMSRESAYRLRTRSEGGLFALLWNRALEAAALGEVHTGALTDGHPRASWAITFGGKTAISRSSGPLVPKSA